jgi:glycosyltransferase involved in cell wall biosynthesis
MRARARKDLGLDESAVVAGWVGSLSSEKDPGTAVRAIARMDAAHLVVAGDGPLRQEIEAQARVALPGRAHFLSALDDVRPVLRAADVLVLTSRTEGLPGVAIEAGLCGLPVVATHVGGVPEIVLDGASGILVPRGDDAAIAEGLRAVCTDRGRMGAMGRLHCEQHFSLDVVAERWATILHSVLEHR